MPSIFPFSGLVAEQDIRLWTPLTPCHALDSANAWRRAASEQLYAASVRQLQPDWLLITSLFEGQGDDAVSAVRGTGVPTSVVLHDLIPYIHAEKYLAETLRLQYYHHQLAHLQNADLLLSNSKSSKKEAIDYLNFPEENIVNISAAADARFRPLKIEQGVAERLRTRYGIRGNFVVYAGSLGDAHKNIPNLIAAYAQLPDTLRADYQLVLVHNVDEGTRKDLLQLSGEH